MEQAIKKFKNILRKWYIPLIVGILFILVAIGIYSAPHISISALMLLFSITLVGFGIRESFFIYSNRKRIKGWGWYLSFSIITILLGMALLGNPLMSIVYINTLVTLLLITKAVQNFVFHFTYREKTETTSGMNWIYSLALIFIALFLWFRPQVITTLMVALSGIPFLIIGTACISLSFLLRKSHQKLKAFKSSFRERTEEPEFEIINES